MIRQFTYTLSDPNDPITRSLEVMDKIAVLGLSEAALERLEAWDGRVHLSLAIDTKTGSLTLLRAALT